MQRLFYRCSSFFTSALLFVICGLLLFALGAYNFSIQNSLKVYFSRDNLFEAPKVVQHTIQPQLLSLPRNLFFAARVASHSKPKTELYSASVTLPTTKLVTPISELDSEAPYITETLDSLITSGKYSRAIYKARVYRLHDQILTKYQIIQFKQKCILLQDASLKKHRMKVFAKRVSKEPTKKSLAVLTQPTHKKVISAFEHQIRQLSANTYVVDKKLLQDVSSNLTTLLQEAAVVPTTFKDGTKVFKITYIKSGSLFEALGLKVNDYLQTINRVALTSLSQLLKAIQQLSYTSTPEIKLRRKTKSITISYQVR